MRLAAHGTEGLKFVTLEEWVIINFISFSGLSCKCTSYFKMTQNQGGPDIQCTACPLGQVSYHEKESRK